MQRKIALDFALKFLTRQNVEKHFFLLKIIGIKCKYIVSVEFGTIAQKLMFSISRQARYVDIS